MADTGIRFTTQIADRTPEQQGEECRRAYESGTGPWSMNDPTNPRLHWDGNPWAETPTDVDS